MTANLELIKEGKIMKISLPTMAISLLLGITAAAGQNIVLESQTDIRWLFPITDIENDGIPELYGEDSQGVPGLYDGSTLQLKWTLPQYPDIDEEGYLTGILSPFLDFNSDGNQDIIFVSTEGILDENEKDVGFRIHDIVNNTTIYEYNDPEAGSLDQACAWIYLADIDGDNDVDIMSHFF